MRVGMSIAPLFTITGQAKKYDGIGSYTFNLMEALKNQVELQPTYFKTVNESLRQPFPLFINSNKHFSILTNPFINQFLPFNAYTHFEKTIDVFHSTDYKVPKLKTKPVIATLHDAIPFKEVTHASSKSRQIKNYLLKTVAANADHVITISHVMQNDIQQYFNIPQEKISVIHHGIHPVWLKPLKTDTDVSENFALNKPFLLVVGTISPKKNCLRIMQAFLQLPRDLQNETQLLFVGKKGWDCDKEMEMLSKMQVGGQAKWLEYVTLEELRALYQKSLALIFPSLNEGFGLPIIEAFASNTPVLTSNIGATAEIAGNAAILVDPLNIEEIMQGLQKLIIDPSFRNNLIAKGCDRAKQFNVEECANKTLAVYQKVL